VEHGGGSCGTEVTHTISKSAGKMIKTKSCTVCDKYQMVSADGKEN